MSPEKCQILTKSAFYENQMRVLWSLSLVLVGVFRLHSSFLEFGDICLVTWWYLFGNRFQLCHQACYPCVGCRPSLSRTECSPLNQTCGAWGSLSGNWPRLGVSRTRALRTEKWWSQWSKAERWTHHTAAQINCEQLFVCLLVCLLACLLACLSACLRACLRSPSSSASIHCYHKFYLESLASLSRKSMHCFRSWSARMSCDTKIDQIAFISSSFVLLLFHYLFVCLFVCLLEWTF